MGGEQKSNPITMATDGDWWVLQVKVPPTGYLSKLLVQQPSGTPVAFKVDVLKAVGNVTRSRRTPGFRIPILNRARPARR